MKISERADEIFQSDDGVYSTRDAAQVWALRAALDEYQAATDARLAKLEAKPVKALDGDWMVMKGGEECGDVNVIAQMGSGAAVTSTCKLPTGHQGRHVDGLFQWWNKSDPTAPPIGHCIDDGSRLGPQHWTGGVLVKDESK